MSRDTQRYLKRNGVLSQLKVARRGLEHARKSITTAEDALKALSDAHSGATQAKQVASIQTNGRVLLPKAILAELQRVIDRIRQAEERVKAVPLTKVERDVANAARRRKAKQKEAVGTK